MLLLGISFLAGVLTVIAPCILPLLPVVVGSAATARSRSTPYVVVFSLGASVILFTYLLKVSTVFIHVPYELWAYISGGIIIIFGLSLVLPGFWANVPGMNSLQVSANKVLGTGYQKKSFWGDVLVGAALGPVFSSCSPTYFVILASVLPASFWLGSLYLFTYTLGLSLVLLLIALLGERFARRLLSFGDPKNMFRTWLGIAFIVLGLLIAFGYEKRIETAILESGFLDVTRVENTLLEGLTSDVSDTSTSSRELEISASQKQSRKGIPYKEITKPAGFVNTKDQPITIGEYIGKKVILLDIMTYSCINCQRTFPYVTSWYEKYKDEGLIVIGIHTPEFAFEKDKSNVEQAMKRFGINFPVVLDNDYGTWNAYGNQYWPRKYLIDIYGNIVYDHIGEGEYAETEKKIIELLKERKNVLEENDSIDESLSSEMIPEVHVSARSPETYFGSSRNIYLVNGTRGLSGAQNLTLPEEFDLSRLYLGGSWDFQEESAEGFSGSEVVYRYTARDVYLVASAEKAVDLEVWQDGMIIDTARGEDVGNLGRVTIQESRLYKIVHNTSAGEHTLKLKIKGDGVNLYTFTFG